MKLPLIVGVTGWLSVAAAVYVVATLFLGCANPQAAASAVVTINHAICDLAAGQTSEPDWETFVCDVLGDRNAKEMRFTVRVPKTQAVQFAARHAALKVDGGGI